MPLSRLLPRRIQHVFDEDAVALRGVIDQHVGDVMIPTHIYTSE